MPHTEGTEAQRGELTPAERTQRGRGEEGRAQRIQLAISN